MSNLFEALAGGVARLDGQSILTVQSLLDSPATVPEFCTIDEEDIFQCGKCKKQFTSIQLFMGHKKEGCVSVNSAGAALLVRQLNGSGQTFTITSASLGQQQISNSTLAASLASGVVLSESELLSLTATIDQAPLTTPSNANSHIHSLGAGTGKTITLQPDVTSVQNLSPQSSVGLSSSMPLLFGSLSNQLIGMPGVMVNISTAFNKDGREDCSDLLTLKAVPQTAGEAVNVLPCFDKQDATPKNGKKTGNTVNIITEFHSSTVKSRKRGAANSSVGEATNTSKKQIRILKCAYCSKTFAKNFDLQQHIRSHTGEKPFQCIVCGRGFAQKSNVKKHLQSHKVWPDGLANTLPQITDVHSCRNSGSEASDKETSSNSKAVDSAPITEENKTSELINSSFVCPYCNFNGKSYYKLKSHLKTHKQEKMYKCILNSCGQMVEDLDAFLEHIKSHESEMLYRCHICTKTFPSLYDLGVHQYSHSIYPNQTPKISAPKISPKYYRCNRCLSKYSTAAALDHHMATSSHSYPCPYCDKIFACERYLRRHLQTHSTSNLHTCDQCEKSFKTQHYLKIHKLIHSEAKPFLCSQCGVAFNRQDKLKRHILIHEPNKRLKCPFRNYSGCMKEFNRPDKLKAHIITHTSNNKSFTCKLCKKTFSRRVHLSAHEATHEHENEPFRCGKCGAGFQKEVFLNEHECVKDRRACPKYSNLLNRRSKKFRLVRKRGRRRKASVQEDVDDIPTSHIEIITTGGDLDVATTELTQFSLQLHPIVTAAEITDGHTVIATADIPFIASENEIQVLQSDDLRAKDDESKSEQQIDCV